MGRSNNLGAESYLNSARKNSILAPLRAGLVYFAIAFAAGFILGTNRLLVLTPRIGEIGAVLLELPIMLAVSWFVCGWLVEKFSIRSVWKDRLVMGGLAFVLLLAAEVCISVFVFGRSIGEHLEAYYSWSALLGLLAQIVFAAMPLVRARGQAAQHP